MKIRVGQRIEIFEIKSRSSILSLGCHISGKREDSGVSFYSKIPHGGRGSGRLIAYMYLSLKGIQDECRPVGAMIIKSVK